MELVILKAKAQINRLWSKDSRRGARAGIPRNMTPAPWLNTTLVYNGSHANWSFEPDYEFYNGTSPAPAHEHNNHWFCAKWSSAQQDLFQAANLCFAIAFLVPKSFKQSILALRAFAAAGAALLAAWAGGHVCAPDVFAWSMALLLANSVHTVFLIIRFLPPVLSLELTDLYLKLFKPLKVDKKHFQELTKEARIVRLEPGEAYAVEEVTPADERLSILIKGKLRVSCDETHLHFIQPYQFVDSPEWEANREQSDDVFQFPHLDQDSLKRLYAVSELLFLPGIQERQRSSAPPQCHPLCHRCQQFGHASANCYRNIKCLRCAGSHPTGQCPKDTPPKCTNCGKVTVIAEELSTCVCWPRMRLERVLRHRPALKMVLDCLIGKDITHKLYSVSEGLSGVTCTDRDLAPAHLTRSASVDAVHEGARGQLRSLNWRTKSQKRQGSSYWQPVIARQFLRKSPFNRGPPMAGPGPVPRLLTQVSSASLQPPPRRKSPPRRATSFRRPREVKFAETPAPASSPEPAV